ncbi:hypothetical protein Dsin_002047 [Dipteronia sinensis]|uniref:Uncharacterized protein n=1 Tax=Dipteronia sinensis TaxID=43782 RepID=A0AAE0EJ09_9ROSI|nr:hypothetical protein Dsin_002047 [Dipteronia sinensis]
MIDSGGELIKVPDPEDSPIKANFGSDLVSPMLGQPKLEGIEPEPEPELEPETRPLVKEIKSCDSDIATYLVRLQEATIEAYPETESRSLKGGSQAS